MTKRGEVKNPHTELENHVCILSLWDHFASLCRHFQVFLFVFVSSAVRWSFLATFGTFYFVVVVLFSILTPKLWACVPDGPIW